MELLLDPRADLVIEKAVYLAIMKQNMERYYYNQTYKKDVDELVKHKERMDWKGLRKQLKQVVLEIQH